MHQARPRKAGFRRYKAARAPAANSSTFMPGAHDAQLSNEGTINVVGGNVHNHYHAPHADIGSLLRALHRRLPNFRKFQIDTLSKATLGTGLWLLADGMYQVWLDLNSGLVIFWTIGMPGAGKSVLA
ncbi:hypothetical protein BKA70DRAFT_642103 [Coprinopsis sp. MPI-PUGE-AT-0042]|nr:hypothetical protein BKA70DRAFT_642103 [Coprinopsis sp. MPI-PUGE-AT-0042]